MNNRLSKYRWQNQTWQQRVVTLLALFFTWHYSMAVMCWSTVIYAQTVLLWRISRPSIFQSQLWRQFEFCSRSWKSTLPLAAAVLAIYFVPHRLRLATHLVWGVVAFTVICAAYDILGHHWDLEIYSLIGQKTRHIYLTWWWWSRWR